MASTIEFTSSGLKSQLSDEEFRKLVLEFQEKKHLYLPNFLDSALLSKIQSLVSGKERSGAFSKDVREFYEVEKVQLSALQFKLSLIFSEPSLITFVERITGKAGIEFTEVGIQRMQGANHFIDWHCDNNGYRFSALSVNLSAEPYEGGDFQIKNISPERVLGSLHNQRAGDAHLFNIGPELRHRVTPVTSTTERRFINLWFGKLNPEAFENGAKLF